MKSMTAFRDAVALDLALQNEIRELIRSGAGMAGVVELATMRGYRLEPDSFAEVEMNDMELELVAGGKGGYGPRVGFGYGGFGPGIGIGFGGFGGGFGGGYGGFGRGLW